MWYTVIFSGVAAFIIAAVFGRFLVPALRRAKAGQPIKEDGPTWHMVKQGTPTMGGLMFILSTGALSIYLAITTQDLGALYVFGFAVVFGFIGFLDDWAKLKKRDNTGLTAPVKFLLQLAVAILFTVLLRHTGHLSPDLYIPFVGVTIHLPWFAYMVFAAIVMVGAVNAVNLTDGLDGLASSVTVPVMVFFTAIAALWGRTALSGVGAALVGGLLGFLLYNFYPAKVFMGDTGSLFLGGAVCGLAFALNVPLVLLLVGIIYIIETLSDIIQVVYFKATHGKRVFKMAPLHHHFEQCGWSENKIVFIFTTISIVFCVLGYFGIADMVVH